MNKQHVTDYRSVGDCKLAAGNEARGLYFDSIAEANELISMMENRFEFCVRPKLRVKRRRTTRTSATCNTWTGIITLYPKGFRVSSLIHELAHLEGVDGHHNHRADFKRAQTKMLTFWMRKHNKVSAPKPKRPSIVKFAYTAPKPEPVKAAPREVVTNYKTKSGKWTTRTEYIYN